MIPLITHTAADIDFSVFALFFRATLTVKLVMLMLIGASIWSWGIAIQKTLMYTRSRRNVALFDKVFWSGNPLEHLYERIGTQGKSGSERIFVAAMSEWQRSYKPEGIIPGTGQRLERAMDVAIGRESTRLSKGLTFLATVGSTAPFIGLFGTVWGIKNAFEEIAIQQNTNLAVVAPGIAEALVATALGLLAAIPAVIFYNKLSADADAIVMNYNNFADEFITILSRQMDD